MAHRAACGAIQFQPRRRSNKSPTSCAPSTRFRTSTSPARELREILANRRDPRREQDTRLQTAFDETQDSIDVLREGSVFPAAVTHLIAARNLVVQAQRSTDPILRRALVQSVIVRLVQGRNAMATVVP